MVAKAAKIVRFLGSGLQSCGTIDLGHIHVCGVALISMGMASFGISAVNLFVSLSWSYWSLP